MPDEEEGADRPRDGHKKLKRPHWRAKFFSQDGKNDEDDNTSLRVNDDVLDFLSSSPQKPQSRAPPQKVGVPPIDVSVSQRWPDSHDISQEPSYNTGELGEHPQAGEGKRRRRPRREGLKVAFSSDKPDIIGEGGDEADLPTMEMLMPRGRAPAPGGSRHEGPPATTHPQRIENPGVRSRIEQDDGAFEPKIILRAPTGLSEPREGAFASQDSSTGVLPPNPGVASTSSIKGSFAVRMKERMRAEEALVFHSRLRDPSPANKDARLQKDSTNLSTPSSLPAQDHLEETVGFTLQPTQIPAVQKPIQLRGREDGAPYTAFHPTSQLPPPYREQPSSRGPSPVRDPAHGSENLQEAKGPPRSIRSAALAVSEDALGDFASRVNHYSRLFSLAAESVKPVMETSLTEWVRCSTWWFLKGRSELETYIRSRSREANDQGSQSSGRLGPVQAFLDLAKALWVNQYIVPQHPELKQYGNMSTTALIAVVQNVGHNELASHLELHQNIIANLRALTMSMKRNQVLPSPESGPPQGLDTSIWIKYPNFTPEISTLLSGTVSKSMVIEGPRRSIGVTSIFPLGDTAERFCYSRMLVSIWLTSDDEKSQPFDLPCMLSVLRDKNDWGITITIGSQNDLVNIVVQADRKQGPTWDDVHWSPRSYAMRIRMSRGFELNVQFQDQDFKSLWDLVENAKKTETRMQAEAGESLIFEKATNTFQYMDNGPARAFPPEPSKRCRIRVFERTVTRSEGFGQTRLHRGFRLIAVTSPKVKTLSSVSQVLGDGAPILFSYLRGDDGAPAIMIKVKDDSGKRSMVLTFHEPAERAELHALLIGCAISDEETESPSLTISSFTILPHEGRQSAVSPQSDLMKQLHWESVRVIDRKHQTPIQDAKERILSNALRICVDGTSGTMTDRVNIGEMPLCFFGINV
jgi:hypothetical protein